MTAAVEREEQQPPSRQRPKNKWKVIDIISWPVVLSTLALSHDGWTADPVVWIEIGFDLMT